jgi:hypothetical protein
MFEHELFHIIHLKDEYFSLFKKMNILVIKLLEKKYAYMCLYVYITCRY